MANANAAAQGKRPEVVFLMNINGGEASLRWIKSFFEKTAHNLIDSLSANLQHVYTKPLILIKLFYSLQKKKKKNYKRSKTFCDRWDSAYSTSHSFLLYP